MRHNISRKKMTKRDFLFCLLPLPPRVSVDAVEPIRTYFPSIDGERDGRKTHGAER